ncbi:hypothetical protein PAXRUDRAFT_577828 [Paxillus rubicundulus Ve08.2h10]|uniref:Uncharacterized protein n=1 Tax=Paxillus rubicundulus Ve08.2h10 TaxID=930991 RepID=A0A0D0DU62_9AGAM|nr:hypothetical protein PAXRUDRAFT_577828 [Paxillus rubicundulus Ve08.2h10]
MAQHKTSPENDTSVRQVNNVLRNLRGEQFRHARNAQGTPASSSQLSSHTHNQRTLPFNLIYPSQTLETSTRSVGNTWVAGPGPPRSWLSPPYSSASSRPKDSSRLEIGADDITNTPAWRELALSLMFSPDIASSLRPSSNFRGTIYPNSRRVPPLAFLCLRLILVASSGPDLVEITPYIPPHLRHALLRYTAVHAPLSQVMLDALSDRTGHVNGELIVVGPRTSLHRNSFQKSQDGINGAIESNDVSTSWDSAQDIEPPPLLSLAVLSSLLSIPTFLTLPPTITHLALINISYPVPLQRLPTTCPLLVLSDLSYNIWLSASASAGRGGRTLLEEVEWGKLRKLEMFGVRGCLVTSKVLLEINRARWKDVKVIL